MAKSHLYSNNLYNKTCKSRACTTLYVLNCDNVTHKIDFEHSAFIVSPPFADVSTEIFRYHKYNLNSKLLRVYAMPEKKNQSDEMPSQLMIRDSILNNLGVAIYVSNLATNKILFANAPLRQIHEGKQLIDKICWKLLSIMKGVQYVHMQR